MPRYYGRTRARRSNTNRRRSRRYNKTTTTRKRSFAKAVSRISRRTTLRQVETKRLVTLNLNYSPTPTDAGYYKYYFKNIFADIFNGVEDSDLLGNELVDPYFTWKWSVTLRPEVLRTLNAAGTGAQTVKWWLILVACNDALTPSNNNGQPSLYPQTTGNPGWFYNVEPDKMTFNGNNVKVLKKMVRQWHLPSVIPASNTQVLSGVEQYSGKMKYRFRKGKKRYEDLTPGNRNPGVLRGWNYYLLGGWWVPNTLTGTPLTAPVAFTCDQYMYYKDP